MARPTVTPEFQHARSCYDHFAGEVAVRICDTMLGARWLVLDGRDFRVTRPGERELETFGVDVGEAHRQHRVFARACVDLTQRRPHIGGALGAALLRLYVNRGWVLRTRGSRVVIITPTGDDAFATRFG
jgi:hypothetical protein